MNVDILLQKLSFYDQAFQCLFDGDQIVLLYLQEKLSLKELKRQRKLMSTHQNPIEIPSCNEVANEFTGNHKNNKKSSNSIQCTEQKKSLGLILEELAGYPEHDNIRSTMAMRNIGQ